MKGGFRADVPLAEAKRIPVPDDVVASTIEQLREARGQRVNVEGPSIDFLWPVFCAAQEFVDRLAPSMGWIRLSATADDPEEWYRARWLIGVVYDSGQHTIVHQKLEICLFRDKGEWSEDIMIGVGSTDMVDVEVSPEDVATSDNQALLIGRIVDALVSGYQEYFESSYFLPSPLRECRLTQSHEL